MKKLFTLILFISSFGISNAQLSCSSGGAIPCPVGTYVDVCTIGCPLGQTGVITVVYICDGAGGIISADVTNMCVLPVELTKFNAAINEQSVKLVWQTASEINNEKFEILRSYNGSRYEVVGEVDGAGQSSERIEYQFIDDFVSLEKSKFVYYRLQQVDLDGELNMSDVIYVKTELSGKLILDKISSDDSGIKVMFESPNESLTEISVFDISGKLISINAQEAIEGTNIVPVTFKGQVSGLYIVQLKNEDNVLSEKIYHKN